MGVWPERTGFRSWLITEFSTAVVRWEVKLASLQCNVLIPFAFVYYGKMLTKIVPPKAATTVGRSRRIYFSELCTIGTNIFQIV